MKIRIFVDSDSSFEYAENSILKGYGLHQNDESHYIQLEANSLCKNMSKKSLQTIEKLGKKHEIKKNEIIFSQDDDAHSLFILLQGLVEIRLYTSSSEYKRLAKYSAGTYFGEISFINPGKRTATAIANSDVILLELSNKNIMDLQGELKELLLSELFFELGSRMGQELRSSAQEIRRLEQV